MNLLRLAPLALFFMAGAAGANAPLAIPVADHVVVDKTNRTITLYADGEPVHTIAGIALGRAPTGHKRFQGDSRTPEGRYTITYGNPQSAYYLSLHISYPNAADTAYARAHGRSAGGDIFIHGQPNGRTGDPIRGDWTEGCIAVSNAEMDLLWQSVPDGTLIDILP